MVNPYQSGVCKDSGLKAFHKQHTSFMEVFRLKMKRSCSNDGVMTDMQISDDGCHNKVQE